MGLETSISAAATEFEQFTKSGSSGSAIKSGSTKVAAQFSVAAGVSDNISASKM